MAAALRAQMEYISSAPGTAARLVADDGGVSGMICGHGNFDVTACVAVASGRAVSVRCVSAGGEGPARSRRHLPAYNRTACLQSADRLAEKLVFVQDNRREFMQGAGRGLEAAARARGLGYSVAFANNDPALMIKQVGAATEKTGAIVVAPIDPPSLAPA